MARCMLRLKRFYLQKHRPDRHCFAGIRAGGASLRTPLPKRNSAIRHWLAAEMPVSRVSFFLTNVIEN